MKRRLRTQRTIMRLMMRRKKMTMEKRAKITKMERKMGSTMIQLRLRVFWLEKTY